MNATFQDTTRICYIATGRKSVMYTLRMRNAGPGFFTDQYIRTLTQDLTTSVKLAKEFAQRSRRKFAGVLEAPTNDRAKPRKTRISNYRSENPVVVSILDDDKLVAKNDFLYDIRDKLNRYGDLSVKQGAAVIAYMLRDHLYTIQREKRSQEASLAPDVPEGKGIEITGVVISIKEKYTPYGDQWKMLVQDDRGFRVYGTQPQSLWGVRGEGKRVRFIANLTKSDKDPKFGFFNRPRKAEYI